MKTRYRHFVWLAAAALIVAACSFGRLAYVNAPPLALWYLGGYVDMSDTQKTWVKERLSRQIAWHRQAELPQYQRAIEQLIVKVESRVSVEDARATYKLAREYYDRTLEHLLPDMAEFVIMLDESQLARMEKKFSDDNRKIVKDSTKGTPDDRTEKRAKKYVEQFEEWTGRLSPAQREIVLNGVKTLPDLSSERVGDRKYRQGEILRLIRAEPPREQLITQLRRLLIDTESWRRPEYTQKLRARDERIIEIISELTATLTPEQRASVQRKMRSYVRDISSIIAEGQKSSG